MSVRGSIEVHDNAPGSDRLPWSCHGHDDLLSRMIATWRCHLAFPYFRPACWAVMTTQEDHTLFEVH